MPRRGKSAWRCSTTRPIPTTIAQARSCGPGPSCSRRSRPRWERPLALEIDLSGRVALVTGGSRGLGRVDALTLARAGADVAIADIQLESDSGEAAEAYGPLAQAARAQRLIYTESSAREIESIGQRALPLRCDVTAREQVDETVRRGAAALRPADILGNK